MARSYKEAFGNYLKHEDLRGRAVNLTVERVDFETIKSDKGDENKLVAHFRGTQKGLVMNLTNAQSFEELSGTDDFDRWTNLKVQLYPTKTKFGSKLVDCIRVRGIGHAGAETIGPPPVVQQRGPGVPSRGMVSVPTIYADEPPAAVEETGEPFDDDTIPF